MTENNAVAMIHADGLSKFYGDFVAIKNVSFSIPKGQIVSFLGPNGAGKSTTMKILSGFLAPSEGLYGFYVVLRNAYGASSPAPTAETEAQRWVLVDFTLPVVQVQDARLDSSPATSRRVQLRWSAYDAHLPPRPVWLHYRTENEANWTPIVERLTNHGRYDWDVPDSVSGHVWIKLTVRDRVGHEAGTEIDPHGAGHVLPDNFGGARLTE